MSIDKKPLIIKELSIGRMPGFTSGMPPYKDFSVNINIIAGPNASGKSTTARAIQKLIWQNKTDRLQMDGRAEIGGEPWAIQIDSKHLVVKRKGVEDEMTGVPAAEEQNRYMLALHDLIKDEGEDLAQRIIRESVGGYDPDKAAEALNYSSGIKPARGKVFSGFEDAEQAVRDCKNLQKKIKADEQKLSDLYRKREEAEAAARKADLYERVSAYLEASKKCSELQSLKQEFPEVLNQAHGEEIRRVEEIEGEIREAETAIQSAEEKRNACEKQLNGLDIPEEGVESKDLNELESRVETISGLEKEIRDLEAEKKSLEKKSEKAMNRIDKKADPEGWTGLNLQDIGELEQFLENAQRTASEKRYVEKEIEELEKERTPETPDKDVLNRGIVSLGQWLKEVPESQMLPLWIIIAIAILSVLSAAAGYFVPLAGLAGLILILILSVYGLIQMKKDGGDLKSELRVQDYYNTGLTAPDAWNPENVQKRLDQLIENLGKAKWQDRISQKIETRRNSLKDLKSLIQEVERKADQMKNRFSALPELPLHEPVSYSKLAWFIKSVQNWQEIEEDFIAVSEKLEIVSDQYQEELGKVSDLIRRYHSDAVDDAAGAVAIFKQLMKQEDQRQKAVDEMERQETEMSKQKDFIKRKQNDLGKIYDKLKLSLGEKDDLRRLTDRLAEYREAVKNCEIADREFARLKSSMQEHSLFEDESLNIEQLTIDQANELTQKFSEEAGRLDDIKDEIKEIEVNVDNVKSGSSLELALKDRDETIEDLKQLYEQNLSSITGQLLVNKLKDQMREQNRPKVFKVANQLFNRITKGRYELEINEKDQPVFMAHDTVEKVWRSLEELSSGTRIQLLLAVRLAFVETQETTLKLPILADELLANSDDQRAAAIIEALTEISKDGRQVFYFTAQADEVARWKSYLSENGDVDHKVFELSGDKIAGDFNWKAESLHNFGLVHNIPESENDTHEQYGKKLDLPGYNPLIQEPEELHIWYLIDDVKALRECLRQGIARWGNLKSYLRHAGKIEFMDDNQLAKLKDKADLLERFQRLYRRGRAKPIDRTVLEESGAVSGSFIKDVSKKLAELNGNPQALVTALRNGEVSGFRTNKTEELESYLLENEYIDGRDSYSPVEIQTQLQAFISNLHLSAKEADMFIKRIIGEM
ncbi:AAA family ATPase [soil metagenome]